MQPFRVLLRTPRDDIWQIWNTYDTYETAFVTYHSLCNSSYAIGVNQFRLIRVYPGGEIKTLRSHTDYGGESIDRASSEYSPGISFVVNGS